MRKLSIFILGLLFFSSCEKETYVDYHIDNQSSGIIFVDGSNIIHSSDLDLTLNPNEKKDVASWSKLGKETDFFEPITMFGDDLVITNVSGDTIIKDYKMLSNWTSDVDDKRAVANHEYILVITDSDF